MWKTAMSNMGSRWKEGIEDILPRGHKKIFTLGL